MFAATVFSQLGTNVGYVALPLIAVSRLGAGPGQIGALGTLGTVAFLLIGLPAGAWVDRMRHRRVLITADLVRAGLFASISAAVWLGGLTPGLLYAIALLNGCATVFFDVGSQSVLPRLVGRESLVQANAAVVSLIAAGNVAGRGAGGALVQVLTAPVDVACTAAAYLASALRLTAVDGDLVPLRPERPDRLGARIADGLRHVFGDRELRALALTATLTNLGTQIVNTMLPVVFVRDLGLPAGALGLTGALAVGSAAAGLIGELSTVRTALWAGAVLLTVAFLPVSLSPVRGRRTLPPIVSAEQEPVRP